MTRFVPTVEKHSQTQLDPARVNSTAGEARSIFAYITSPSFSGSTLLTFLLNAHPGVCTVGELKAGMKDGYNYVCSCGQTLSQCRFWRAIRSGHERQGRPLDLNDFGMRFERQSSPLVGKILGAAVRGPLAETIRDTAVAMIPPLRWAKHRTLRRIETFARIASQITGAKVFLDGSKDPFRLKYLPALNRFGLKTIRIIRDGRGVMNSTMRNENQPPEAAAESFRRISLELDHLERRLPRQNYIRIHYEQLCREPDRQLDRLYRFLGLDPALAAGDYRQVDHHIMGNRMRLQNSSEIRLDEKWRTELKPEDLDVFDRIAGDLNRELGYE